MGLSIDIFHMILDEIIVALEVKKLLRLRLVNSKSQIAYLDDYVFSAETCRNTGNRDLTQSVQAR